jgi:hypothetical protein
MFWFWIERRIKELVSWFSFSIFKHDFAYLWSQVRSAAQGVLLKALRDFPGSYIFILDEVLEMLAVDPDKNQETFKVKHNFFHNELQNRIVERFLYIVILSGSAVLVE